MDQSLSAQEIERLFILGDRYLHQGKFSASVATFEQLLSIVDSSNQIYFDIQRGLVKAYHQNQQLEHAIALCQSLADSDVAATALWGQNFLPTLTLTPIPDAQPLNAKSSESESEPEAKTLPSLKLKTLSQFKQYCQDHLLEKLRELERSRKHTLRTMFLSGLVCLFFTWCFCFVLSFWLGVDTSLWFYLFCLILPASAWVIFCRGCIYTYGIGFKRNIIESIVNFIGDEGQLNYAAHLFLENKRQTILALTRSQILGDELAEPDYLEQEDCVYGTIGNTDIFFAEIIAKKIQTVNFDQFTRETYRRETVNFDQFTRETYRRESVLFHGLFFEAKFAKNFISRTFVMPNDLKAKIVPLNQWRGDAIKLEDPEFNRIFRVYGDNQIESRYILSTNLMSRLVEFNQKVGRKAYLSFVDGFVYVAIPYRYSLFEPKLFKTMMSFTPLKEYFLDLQLMISIVEDLNLNRRIWG